MKKVKDQDEIRLQYKREDLGVGVRGKYYEAYNEGHNLVLLKPEVAKAFPSEDAVNDALLSLIKIAQASIGLTSSSNGRGSSAACRLIGNGPSASWPNPRSWASWTAMASN